MVFGQGRNIARANAVFLHAHAVCIQTANDWAVGTGSERRSGNARFGLQRFGNRCAVRRFDLAFGRDGYGYERVVHHEQRARQLIADRLRRRRFFDGSDGSASTVAADCAGCDFAARATMS